MKVKSRKKKKAEWVAYCDYQVQGSCIFIYLYFHWIPFWTLNPTIFTLGDLPKVPVQNVVPSASSGFFNGA